MENVLFCGTYDKCVIDQCVILMSMVSCSVMRNQMCNGWVFLRKPKWRRLETTTAATNASVAAV